MLKFGIVLFLSFAFSMVVVLSNPFPVTTVPMTDKINRSLEYNATVDRIYFGIIERVAPINNTIKGVFNRFFSNNPDSAITKFVQNFDFLDRMVTCVGNIVEKLLVVVNNIVKMSIRSVSQAVALVLEGRYCYQTYPLKEATNMGSCAVDMVTIALNEMQASFTRLTADTGKIIKNVANWSYIFRHCGNKNPSKSEELLATTPTSAVRA